MKSKLHVLCDISTPAAFWLACFSIGSTTCNNWQ